MIPLDKSDLGKCPFCGADNLVRYVSDKKAHDYILCLKCKARGPESHAINRDERWNTRTPDPVFAKLKRVSKFADSLKVKPDNYDYGEGMNATCITIKAFVDSIIFRLEPETKGGQDG